MAERLEAHYQNRTYYFYVKDKKEEELWIEMYKTPYYFVKKDGIWRNHSSNKMNMIDPLIEIVAAAAGMV